jgi:hypothetical protein
VLPGKMRRKGGGATALLARVNGALNCFHEPVRIISAEREFLAIS